LIRSTSTSFTDSGDNNIAAMFWHGGGDNIVINANVECGEIPCVISYGQGTSQLTGNLTINGDITSKREIVQQYVKLTNGNGWMDVIIKNGFITSKGQGLSGSMFHRSGWSYFNGGVPGNTRLINCVIYNQNLDSSATACIVRDNGPDVGKNNNFQFYNCLAFVETSGFLASSSQAAKIVSMHNVRSNRPLDTTVTDGFSPTGIIVDASLTIPKSNINN